MWQRFTIQARHAVYVAQVEATALQDNYVGSEHLLLGVLAQPDDAGSHVLIRLDTNIKDLDAATRNHVQRGAGRSSGDMRLNRHAKRAIDQAYEEARAMGDHHIGTEHLLLGIVLESDRPQSLLENLRRGEPDRQSGIGALLRSFGLDVQRVRDAVKAMRGNNLLRAAEAPGGREALLRPAPSAKAGSTEDLLRPSGGDDLADS